MEIKIPFLGDGIESANVIGILFNIGDTVSIDDTIIELETDKATAPVPSIVDGVIKEIHVKEGDVVKEGNLVAIIETNSTTDTPPKEPLKEPVQSEPKQQKIIQTTAETYNNANYEAAGNIDTVNCSPSIRRFAHLSGLDLVRINGSGKGGRIIWDDINNYLQFLQSTAFNKTESPTTSSTKESNKKTIDFSKFGDISTEQMTSMRQKISDHLSNAWTTIPHVTQFADINIDSIMAIRKEENAKQNEIKLTVTIFIIKAIVETLKSFPTFNASINGSELILKHYYHIGVAVDTETGLVVPVLKNVDKKTIIEIAKELDSLAEKARTKSLAVNDIQGATFTLSNLGGLGASHFTPIVNSPEVAILGTGRAKHHVSYDESTSKIKNTLLMPVALSYDHRVIDGADGARFVHALTENIQNFKKEWVN